ncbi:MAG TPA: GMC family oxidoreductase [Pilimelia sp.]|nr:GMC family oxidoreductase [Pilimelia sp.]
MTDQTFDAVVVGSGCAGSWAAKELTEAGLHTLVLEAGPQRGRGEVPARSVRLSGADPAQSAGAGVDPADAFTPTLDGGVPTASRRVLAAPASQHVQRHHPGFGPRGPHLFVDDAEHPYETPADMPYHWIRGMQVGGRSLVWGGTSLRMSPYEFQAPTVDGHSLSWPLRYEELAPSYAVVEKLMGISGNRDGLPQLPDGVYSRRPGALTPAERDFQRAYRSAGTRAVAVRFVPAEDGLGGWPRFTMQGTALAAAERTGHLRLRPDAVVTKILADPSSGRATGVRYLDNRGAAHDARARVVFICCGTIETARLMLNSRGPRHPDGFGNSSGWLGCGLTEHPVVMAAGVLTDYPPVAGYEWSARQCGLLIPPPRRGPASVRPFGIWVNLQRLAIDGQTWGIVSGQGELLPYRHNRVRLGAATDRWGVPVPHIECAYGPHEERLYGAMKAAVEQVASAAKLKIMDVSAELTVPGLNVHELGTARMGADPGSSVVDADNRCWDSPNVFVTDGACFPSAGWQNPSATIMALSVRAGRRAAALLREGVY